MEMPPKVLLDRQLARLSGIDLSTIRHRRLGPEHTDRIERALSTLEPLAERLCFVQAPSTWRTSLGRRRLRRRPDPARLHPVDPAAREPGWLGRVVLQVG